VTGTYLTLKLSVNFGCFVLTNVISD